MKIRKLLTALFLGLGLTLALVWLLGDGPLPVARAANFAVDIFTDENDSSCSDGDCSLRDAIIIANGNGEADVITLGAGTYALSLVGTGENEAATGDLDVTEALTITGLGPEQTIIDASGVISDRVLDVRPGAGTVVISGVTIMNGHVIGSGGGIYNDDADLTLVNVIVSSNVATGTSPGGYGGGVYVRDGSVALQEGQILSNTAVEYGGGVYVGQAAATFVQTGASIIAHNIVIGAGSSSGGGVYVGSGHATLSGGQIYSNTADNRGGGVFVNGHATLSGTQIFDNTANDGGGVFIGSGRVTLSGGQILSNTARYDGGGIHIAWSDAVFTQTGDSAIAYNTADDEGGGVCVKEGSAILSGTQVISNAARVGGGLFVGPRGAATLNGGAILSNTASGEGGGVYMGGYLAAVFTQTGDSLIAFNVAENGGGLRVYRGSATLNGAQIRNNTAQGAGTWDGGGGLLVSAADVTLDSVQIVSNTSNARGGGVYLNSGTAMVRVNRGRITHNTAQALGGGLCNSGGALALLNTTVSGNAATTDGGGFYNGSGTSVLTFTTVASNTTSGDGGGIYNSSGGTVRLLNTLLAHNGPANCSGAVASDGHNLDNGASCGLSASGDITDTDPLIGPLDAEGVHPLLPGSPAIDHGLCLPGVTTDQRGMPRSQVAGCDIGAYELSAVFPLEKVTISGPSSAAVGASVEFVATVSPATASQPITYVWQATGQPPATHLGGGASDAVSFVWDAPGAKTITVTASNVTSTVQATHTVELSLMPALVIAKDGPAEAIEGYPITYTLTVTNVGSAAAETLVITDALPAAAYYLSGGAYDPVGHAVTWTAPSLAADRGAVQVNLVVAAAQTVANADYRVSASGGYSATGIVPVVTVVMPVSIRYVASDGADGQNTCGYSANPCATIQHAVDVAGDGNEIRVAAGTYTGAQTVIDSRTGYTYTQVVFITKTLTLRGGYDANDWGANPDPAANPTVIDAERQGRCVSIVGDWPYPAVTVDGFTITGGDYTGLHNVGESEQDRGGGLYAYRSGLTLRNCVVSDNVASRDDNSQGGGLYLWPSSADPGILVENTHVISNSSESGGGLYASDVSSPITITRSTFQDNTADYYGGMALPSVNVPLTILGTDFLSNTAQTGDVGGVYVQLYSNADLHMDRVRFQNNHAEREKAALLLTAGYNADGPRARLSNVLFSGNRLTSTGDDDAVIYISQGSNATGLDISLSHVTAADNQAPTFLYAEAWGADHWATMTLTNTLLVSFTNGFAAYEGSGGEALIRHTNTMTDGVTTLHHTVAGTPTLQAINPLSGDPKLDATYHLQVGSDAIDAGVEAGVDHDLDGDFRPQGPAPDVGADEFAQIAPTSASISGPAEGIVGQVYTFTASYEPLTANQPVSYTWSPGPDSGQGTDTAAYSWDSPGAKTISVTVENVYGAALPATHEIVIAEYKVYLPLVVRN
jgi:uncharacterized repeat protein (TIGR01451 family)/CSLREA domain-containing protein